MATAKYELHRGKRFVLKENGLPINSGLFWIDADHKYIACKVHGERFSCNTAEWKVAIDFAEEKRNRWDYRNEGVPIGDVKVGELLDDLIAYYEDRQRKRGEYGTSTAYNTKSQINIKSGIRDTFGGIKVSKLKPLMYTEYWRKWELEYVDQGKKVEKVQNTIRHHLRHLGRALSLGKENMKVPANVPMPKPGKDDESDRHNCITFDQLDILLSDAGLPDYIKPLLVTCIFTGFRKKEATFIHRTDAHLTERIITLRAIETKSGKTKSGSIPEKYWPFVRDWELRNQKQFPKADYLFHLDGERLTTEHIDDKFNSTCERLKWHVPAKDETGNPIIRKNRTPKYDRSACRWHDARRTATTTISGLENLTDVDRRRTLGISEMTQARYDQTQSTVKVRDAMDKKLGAVAVTKKEPVQPAIVQPSDRRTKLIDLKSLFDDGLIDETIYRDEQKRIIAGLA